MPSKPNEFVVRDRGYGSGKHHIPTDDSFTETLCGVKPSSVGSFAYLRDRAAFEELCPQRICKRCRKAEEQRSASWQMQILDTGAAALAAPGAVVVRWSRQGPEVVSRVYSTDDYETPSNEAATSKLRRVAVRRCTRLLNADQEGRNHYVVIRYASGQVVVWTGMHSILCESGE